MRAVRIFRDLVQWRWAPLVALSAGALVFVGLSWLLIPSQFEPRREPTAEQRLTPTTDDGARAPRIVQRSSPEPSRAPNAPGTESARAPSNPLKAWQDATRARERRRRRTQPATPTDPSSDPQSPPIASGEPEPVPLDAGTSAP
jgi:hypothetical protein